jgi:hypothetical protein
MPITIQKIARTEAGDYRVLVSYKEVRGESSPPQIVKIPQGSARNAGELQAAIRAAVIADAGGRVGRRPPAVPAPIAALEGQTISEA